MSFNNICSVFRPEDKILQLILQDNTIHTPNTSVYSKILQSLKYCKYCGLIQILLKMTYWHDKYPHLQPDNSFLWLTWDIKLGIVKSLEKSASWWQSRETTLQHFSKPSVFRSHFTCWWSHVDTVQHHRSYTVYIQHTFKIQSTHRTHTANTHYAFSVCKHTQSICKQK